jgi:ABC-type transport system substrate-binding protein
MSISFLSKGGRNFTGFSDPKMDGYIDAAYAEFDESKRAAILRDAQKVALENWSHIPTHHAEWQALVHPTVKNLDLGSVAEPSNYVRFAWLTKS